MPFMYALANLIQSFAVIKHPALPLKPPSIMVLGSFASPSFQFGVPVTNSLFPSGIVKYVLVSSALVVIKSSINVSKFFPVAYSATFFIIIIPKSVYSYFPMLLASTWNNVSIASSWDLHLDKYPGVWKWAENDTASLIVKSPIFLKSGHRSLIFVLNPVKPQQLDSIKFEITTWVNILDIEATSNNAFCDIFLW